MRTKSSEWQPEQNSGLPYWVGGVAPLVTLSFYLTQVFVIVFGNEPFPTAVEEWFLLFHRNIVLGLFYINALDIFSITILGLMFLALYAALRNVNEPAMTIAAFFAYAGIPVFVVPRVIMLSIVPLSDQYVLAETETRRTILLAAGEMLNSLGTATPQTIGFLFIAVASMLISIVILRSEVFSHAAAYVGLIAGVLTIIGDICVVFIPAISAILMPVCGLLWIIWWVMISLGLFNLAKE